MTTLCLVDLSAVFWFRWAASAAKPAGTAYEETVSRVRRLTARFPGRTAVCCDAGRSFRYDIDPEYKAKRPPKDQAALEQLALVCEELTKLGLPLLKADGFEGDDVIATVTAAALAADPKNEVVIAGQDKDLLALIGPRVSLLNIQSGAMWGAAEVKAKFGVEPGQMRDFLALVGDSSDNIKGVPKIGEVNAARLLGEFGSVEKLIASLDEKDGDAFKIKPDAIRKALVENLGALDLAIRLVTLRTDAPIDCAALFAAMSRSEETRAPEPSAPPPPVLAVPPPRPVHVTRPVPRDEEAGDEIARARAAAPTCPTSSSLIRSSPWINHLAAALAAAQGEFDMIEKDRTAQIRSEKGNFSYGYATLASVLSSVRPALARHGLAVAQVVSEGALVTRVMHSSGQWIEGDVPMRLDMSRPQAAGSLLTYFRRYALSALLCVAPDEDDDGASASAHAH